MQKPDECDRGPVGGGGEGQSVGGAAPRGCGQFSRVIKYDGDDDRKMTPMDVWAFMHPGFKQVPIQVTLIYFHFHVKIFFVYIQHIRMHGICSFQYLKEMDTTHHFQILTKQFWTVYTKPNI